MNIQKWTVETDPTGRVLSKSGEHLRDAGNGLTRVVRTVVRRRCCGCGRPLESAAQITGRCDCCPVGPLCIGCESRCASCARRVCRHCKRGFVWGTRPLTVCPNCLTRLHRRIAYEQRMVARRDRTAQRAMTERLRLQQQALRLRIALRGHRP
jgi:hypothetical protein